MLPSAIHLANTNDKTPSRDEVIQYIYTDSQHQNPLNRVVAAGDSSNNSGLGVRQRKIQRDFVGCR